MVDAGLEEERIMEFSGHVTRSIFYRYNISREEDATRTRDAIDRFHERQESKP